MKGSRYTDEQIVRILGEVDRGKPVAEVCRQYGVAEATVYRWRAKYRGMDRAQLRKLKHLEVENRRLKRIVAQQAVDIDVLKDLYRELPRQTTGRVLESISICQRSGSSGDSGGVETGVQSVPAAQFSWVSDAGGVCGPKLR